MKISELIQHLEKIKEKEENLDVYFLDREARYFDLQEVDLYLCYILKDGSDPLAYDKGDVKNLVMKKRNSEEDFEKILAIGG